MKTHLNVSYQSALYIVINGEEFLGFSLLKSLENGCLVRHIDFSHTTLFFLMLFFVYIHTKLSVTKVDKCFRKFINFSFWHVWENFFMYILDRKGHQLVLVWRRHKLNNSWLNAFSIYIKHTPSPQTQKRVTNNRKERNILSLSSSRW